MKEESIKTKEEIEILRKAGKILANILNEIKKDIKVGTEVWDLELKFLKLCEENKVIPACKGYTAGIFPPFPTGLCASINNQSVHCFPKKGIILKDGDIISIDTVVSLDGYHADSAFCVYVGNADAKTVKLVETSKKALNKAILKVREGVRTGVISETIQKTVEKEGFNVLKDYAGHGIGISMHEYPEILCYGSKRDGPKLKEGMVICIESLVCEGNDNVDNVSAWETCMSDGGLFCTFEHSILVTKKGYEILT